jgi:hypothetical protein
MDEAGNKEGQRLAEDEALLRKVQDEQVELVPTAKGLFIMIEPCKDASKTADFFRDIMAYAGKVTQSITPEGVLTSRFAMVGPSCLNGRPFVCLSCFNRGFETLEFALVHTKARLLAVRYGLKIVKIDATPDFPGVRESAGSRDADESGVETSKNGRKIVGKITFPDGNKSKITAVVNDQFNNLSPVAIMFIAMTVGISGRTGKALGEFVRAALDTNPKLLELMAERAMKMYEMEIISVDSLGAEDLATLTHDEKSFVFRLVPEQEWKWGNVSDLQ